MLGTFLSTPDSVQSPAAAAAMSRMTEADHLEIERQCTLVTGPLGPDAKVPPIAKILGKKKWPSPTVPGIEKLTWHLDEERRSRRHASALTSCIIGATLSTYETDDMKRMGFTRMLVGRDAQFQMQPMTLAGDDCAPSPERGEKGFPSGSQVIGFPIGNSYFIFMGECVVTAPDIWFFTVHYNEGNPLKKTGLHWPDQRSVYQCPFCASLACPGETKIMISQFGLGEGACGMGVRMLARMYELGCGPDDPRLMEPVEGAGELLQMYERTGMMNAASVRMARDMSTMLGGRQSKRMTSENGGMPTYKINGGQTSECGNGCGKTKAEADLKVCSRCNLVKYCSRECQKAHWKTHKKTCNKI
ncbi:hypothetical protein TeGR_g13185 [Tetraparma gracilis]|uniref:MYND-type domain-containing protein n=1 Tax=Tetraparma gracilis TaxID=2962635 RepID=A0ABQ6MSH3_9STRA|nr:hypothetical protein TeGR_g13185 [Tetraparma gracilis]